MPTDYPPLPWPYCREFREPYERYTADQMHAYLATERARIEREVMPLVAWSADSEREAILRAIRGEKEPT